MMAKMSITTIPMFLVLVALCKASVFDKMYKDTVLRVSSKIPGLNEREQESDPTVWPPPFCHKLDCPKFTVVKKKAEYEVRKYDTSRWVSTSLQGLDYDESTEPMFMRLFNYISGANVKKEKIDMTAPVLVKVLPGQGPACKDDFTMSFFIAPKVTDPPRGTNPNVTLTDLPGQTVYVSEYPGFSDQKKVIEHAADLFAALQKDKVSFEENYYFSAGYDAPFKVFNRHNEIWVVGK